jgi:hypothetical protein
VASVGVIGAVIVTLDEVGYPSGWWTDSHGNHRHVSVGIAAIVAVALAAIAASAGQELAESRKEKSIARRAGIEQMLGVILANIVEYSIEEFDKSLKNLANELRDRPGDLCNSFDELLAARTIPSITKMAAYYYELQILLWRRRLVRRGRFAIGADRPVHMKSRYKLKEANSIGEAGRTKRDACEIIRLPSSSTAILANTPLFSEDEFIGLLSIVAEPGNKLMQERLLGRATTDRLAGWRTALAKVIGHVPT